MQAPLSTFLTAMAANGVPLQLAIEASRGASIAVHAAAGLSRGQAPALRLLRAAEGLCRSAVAALQASAVASKDKGGKRDDSKGNKGKVGKEDTDARGGPKNVAGGSHHISSRAACGEQTTKSQRRRQRRRAARCAAALPVSDAEFDDAWADGVSIGPVRRASPLPRSRSGSRSPRRDEVAPAEAASGAAGLREGRVASVQGVVSRPDLVGALVLLLAFDEASGRWVVRTAGGERLRLLPGRLAAIPDKDQTFSRLRFEKGVV